LLQFKVHEHSKDLLMEVICIEKLRKAFLLYSSNKKTKPKKKTGAIHVLKIVECPGVYLIL